MALVGTVDLLRAENLPILNTGGFAPEGIKGTAKLVGAAALLRGEDLHILNFGAISAGQSPTSKFIGSFMFFRLRPRT